MGTQAEMTATLNVLLVDDSPDVVALTSEMLRELGTAQIYTASDGGQALELLSTLAPDQIDAILCDWNMPRVTGIEVLKHVRSTDPDIPFLLLTGATDADSLSQCKQYRISGYLTKPFSKDDLQRKMRTIAQVVAFRKKRKA